MGAAPVWLTRNGNTYQTAYGQYFIPEKYGPPKEFLIDKRFNPPSEKIDNIAITVFIGPLKV